MGKYLDLLDQQGQQPGVPAAPPEQQQLPEGVDPETRAWAEAEAQRLREQNPTLETIYSGARSITSRFPIVGEYMDEGAAGLHTGFGYLGDYDRAVELERARARRYAEEHPVADAVGGTVGVAGPIVATLPFAAGHIPATALGKAGAGLVGGGIVGSIEGYGSGDTPEERRQNAAEGAKWGAGLGLAAGPVAAGVGKAAKWGMQGWQRLGKWLAGMPDAQRKAATRTLMQLEESGMSADDAVRRLQELGPEGMLADVSPTMQMQTARVVTSEPATASKVAQRLGARQTGAGGRVSRDLDDTLGPATDRYDRFLEKRTAQAATGPAYEAAKQTVMDPTDVIRHLNDLAKEVKRPDFVRHMARVRRMLPLERGKTVKANTLHEAREYLDDAIGTAHRSGQGKLANRLGELRSTIDGNLKAIGYADPDAAYSRAAKEFDDFEYGRREVLRGGMDSPTPGMVAARKQARPGADGDISQGLRSRLDDATANQRRNPGVQAENVLAKDRNLEKVRELVGPERTARLQGALERERTFHDTGRLVDPRIGSPTAARQSLKGERGPAGELRDWAIAEAVGTGLGAPGVGTAAVVVRGLTRKGLDKLAERTAKVVDAAQADMLTATGRDRVKTVQDLTDLAKDLRKAGAAEEAGQVMGFALTISQGHRAGTTGAEAVPALVP